MIRKDFFTNLTQIIIIIIFFYSVFDEAKNILTVSQRLDTALSTKLCNIITKLIPNLLAKSMVEQSRQCSTLHRYNIR